MGGSSLSRLGSVASKSEEGGPSEVKLGHLERYEAARSALGRLYDVVSGVVEADVSVREYCARFDLPASATLGRLIAALDVLVD